MDNMNQNNTEGRPSPDGLTESDLAFLTEYRLTLPERDGGDTLGLLLHAVVELAVAKHVPGVPLPDLVAEGNLGLTEALAETDLSGKGGIERAVLAIGAQMDRFLAAHAAMRDADEMLAEQVAALSEAIDIWNRDYGERPTIDELANMLGVTQQRVLDILYLSGDAPSDM